MSEPLHQQRPTQRFADRADDYRLFRPSYPAAAVDAVLEGLGDLAALIAADVGAGTGISAALLADRGVQVIAVEPNEAMRSAARPHPNVHWLSGTAEQTGLASASVDVVVCAQAFHWFDAPRALAEFARVLKPRGRVALMWNNRDDRAAFTAEYGRATAKASGEHAAAKRVDHHEPLAQSELFEGMERIDAPSEQVLDVEGLLGRARSASYVPKSGAPWDELERDLRAAHGRFADHDGLVRLRYVTSVYRAGLAMHRRGACAT